MSQPKSLKLTTLTHNTLRILNVVDKNANVVGTTIPWHFHALKVNRSRVKIVLDCVVHTEN